MQSILCLSLFFLLARHGVTANIVARWFESACARYNTVHTHKTNEKLVSLMYSTVKYKYMYSYAEQVVPVIVFLLARNGVTTNIDQITFFSVYFLY